MHASRDRGKGQPRILYWFRTPPNVRVGRAALDEGAIRAIEEHNPGLKFDWTRILKTGTGMPGPAPVGRDRDRRAAEPRTRAPSPPPAATGKPSGRTGPASEAERSDTPSELEEPRWPSPEAEVADAPQASEAVAEAGSAPARHVEERLSREALDRLRARYAELLARIAARVTDPGRLDELRAEAERLNPDTWVTDQEVQRGLERFDAGYEALRARLGRRRRRGGARRRRARLARLQGAQNASEHAGPRQHEESGAAPEGRSEGGPAEDEAEDEDDDVDT
jgi:hypothetical protein